MQSHRSSTISHVTPLECQTAQDIFSEKKIVWKKLQISQHWNVKLLPISFWTCWRHQLRKTIFEDIPALNVTLLKSYFCGVFKFPWSGVHCWYPFKFFVVGDVKVLECHTTTDILLENNFYEEITIFESWPDMFLAKNFFLKISQLWSFTYHSIGLSLKIGF